MRILIYFFLLVFCVGVCLLLLGLVIFEFYFLSFHFFLNSLILVIGDFSDSIFSSSRGCNSLSLKLQTLLSKTTFPKCCSTVFSISKSSCFLSSPTSSPSTQLLSPDPYPTLSCTHPEEFPIVTPNISPSLWLSTPNPLLSPVTTSFRPLLPPSGPPTLQSWSWVRTIFCSGSIHCFVYIYIKLLQAN
ncbi:unnamed protein product [Moneuplotes crassus]|uniref:Uncharacterized protein n=1 Tax=Euplotes crassus TaxID=5936 RepID=A0AAD1XZJ2_EUPCR|nr:unnamed protein product [Moneuplotes crassus]